MIRPNRSIVSLLCLAAVIGSVLIITASEGLFSQNDGFNSFSSSATLISRQLSSLNIQAPAKTTAIDPEILTYDENSTACGYCDANPYSHGYSEYPAGPAIVPYYPQKFWNYPPPGYMPLVPHTDPALYYSETSSAAGMTSGFEKGLGYLYR
jgi:hypothetical protein